ncbi:MAG TPA: hypothetical protein VK434_16105, partial [Microvirga sp.]|nr:hypothetical protein [Microvirga sp.]
MTDSTLAHLPASRADGAPALSWAAMREQVRETIRAEVSRLNPTDDARRPLELIIESSVRYSATDEGTRISVVDAGGQPRTVERDGKVAALTIRDLLEELRLTHPALFRPADRPGKPVAAPAPAAPASVPEEPAIRKRDWLSVGSAGDADEPRRDGTLFRLRRGKVRLHGWSRRAAASPKTHLKATSPEANSPEGSLLAKGSPATRRTPQLQFVPDRNLFSLDRVRNVFGGVRSRSQARGQGLGIAAIALLAL